ncbi:MAG: hypothetical protein ACT4PE_08860, partial [Candidatus Eiseniibacteriota bacterium]
MDVTVTQFDPAAQGEGHFELWFSFAIPRLRHSANASAGKFRVDATGAVVGLDGQPATFAVDTTDPDAQLDGDGEPRWSLVLDAFITIEAAGDDDDVPGSALVGGAFLNGTAQLSPGHADAVNRNFAGIGGSFLLETPSTSTSADAAEGIWFVAPGGGSASLDLPALPAGWVYEAWVSNNSAGITTLGRFSTVGGPDSDADGPLSGAPPTDGAGYPFPGSDFPYATGGVDLSAASVFITLEPADNADGPGPFFLELLGAP